MGILSHLAMLGMAGAAIGSTIRAFGGEDPLADGPAPTNWHHEGLTKQAAESAGWDAPAGNALAFHADYLDSYLYSPLWWFSPSGGGPDRLSIAMSSAEDLIKVHFDDLVHPESIRGTWRRNLSGTAAGLIWLGGADSGPLERRVAMAQNLIGASLHGIQDFYSHSNWIDDEDLRERTWFEVDPETRDCLSLWSGTYELPDHLGILPHGEFIYACTVINNLGSAGRSLMDVACHAASPFANSSMCTWFRQCINAEELRPPTVEIPVADVTVETPERVLWVVPGMNVDNRWSAEKGVRIRGLYPSVSASDAFEKAYTLAYRSSCQWLHLLQDVMESAGLTTFWDAVKSQGTATDDDYKTPIAPWEDFGQLPYRFISAGPYPPPVGHDDTSDWYLRLLIRTSNDAFSGTNADIRPIVNGKEFPILDHGVRPAEPPPGQPPVRTLDQALLGRDDFEAGSVAAYMIGPIDEQPRTVSLRNDAPDAGDVLQAAVNSIVRGFQDLFNSVVGLWGYHADFVGEAHWDFSPAVLETIGAGSRRYFYLDCDGGSEGEFVVSGYVEGTSQTGRFANGVPFRRFRVQFLDLICVRESAWDRFTPSDEPFVLGLVIPHGGTQSMTAWRTEPYGNVNSGDTNPIARSYWVEVPQRYGFLSVACAVYESDDETPNDRDYLLSRFSGSVASAIAEPEDSFVEALGDSIAAGWKVGSIEAVAFQRSATVQVRPYAPRTFDVWVDGGHSLDWTLADRPGWSVDVPDTLACGHKACTTEVQLPGLKPKIETLDFGPKVGVRGEAIPDQGHEATVDLRAFHPHGRPPRDPYGEELVIDEPPSVLRPRDGCAEEDLPAAPGDHPGPIGQSGH